MTNYRQEAIDFLASLPRKVRTCETAYPMALALQREGVALLSDRAVLGNGQVRYLVSCAYGAENTTETVR